jgi:PilZ domain
MPFSLRPYRRFPMRCSVTYNAGPFQGQGTAWNLSMNGWRLSGDPLMRPGEILSLTVTLPNEQHILIPVAVVRWSRGQEFAVENLAIEPHTRARLQHYVNRLVRNQRRISCE